MNGETDLARLLGGMRPFLHEEPVVFCVVRPDEVTCLPFEPIGVFREDEGTTVIAPAEEARKAGFACSGLWAHITLQVHSPLEAVGLIAAVAGALARRSISVNPVAAFHHDHLFVPWEKKEEAMGVLIEMESAE